LPAVLLLGGRRVQRSRYPPDPRRLPETLTALAGVGAGTLLFAAAVGRANLYPLLSPLEWPRLALLPVLSVALAAVPARLTPPPPTAAPAPATDIPACHPCAGHAVRATLCPGTRPAMCCQRRANLGSAALSLHAAGAARKRISPGPTRRARRTGRGITGFRRGPLT